MPLDPANAKKVEAWLQKKFLGGLVCSACHTNRWQIIGLAMAPGVERGGNIAITGQIVPMVQLACANCSNVMFFAAVPMGIDLEPLPSSDEPASPSPRRDRERS